MCYRNSLKLFDGFPPRLFDIDDGRSLFLLINIFHLTIYFNILM